MTVETVFITRFVADHAVAVKWYTTFFGCLHDHEPMGNCREWSYVPASSSRSSPTPRGRAD